MSKIVPVVLCGGVGSRLWPLSRKSLPKQFAQLIGEESLFEAAVKRVNADVFAEPIIVTSSEHRFLVEKQLRDCGCSGTILLEPDGKNTAPAIFAAAYHVVKLTGDELLLVMPSDHHIPDKEAFHKMVFTGCMAANEGAIVTFGVVPNRPETGYGYLELGDMETGDAYTVEKFHEKPDRITAEEMINSKNYLWNAGIFLFRASALLAHAKDLEPKMLSAVQQAVDDAREDKNFWHIDQSSWSKIQGKSVDYAILEQIDHISCVKFSGSWSDLGDWSAVADELLHDEESNLITGPVNQIDCRNTTLWSASKDIQLVGLGLNNVVTVVTDDAVLVADARRMQDVGEVVKSLEMDGISQAHRHPKDYRPWGWFESLAKTDFYHVKRLHIYPKSSLSLQSHSLRSEHWVVVSGEATVQKDTEILTLHVNQSVFIDVGQKHRLENHTDYELIVIEVQTGSYFGEDDIVRFNDEYERQ